MQAASYVRLSRDDVRQTSIPRQRAVCQQDAARHGYILDDHHIFSDDGISGAILERPGLEEMLALARSGKVQAVFVADGDRLSREPAHDWLIRQDLKRYGVTLYVSGQPIDESPEGEVKDGLLSLFAKYEKLKTAQRMRQGKLRRAGLYQPPGAGRPLVCYTALGYRYIPDSPGGPAHLELIKEEADIVRRIYRLYLSGMGVLRIARLLTSERVPTKMDRLSGRTVKKQRTKGVWSKSSVHKEEVCSALLSSRRMLRVSGKAWRKALTKSWTISAFRYGNARKHRAPLVGSTAP